MSAQTLIGGGALPDVISAQGLTGCLEDNGTCGKKIAGRGRCRTHYVRWWRANRNTERPPALNLRTKTPEQRFREKVNRRGADECWEWQATHDKFGHGQFFVSRERGKVQAHSYALELATGQRCPEDKEACHHCDNPPCVNPAHVYFGTRLQNVRDMWNRGRAPYGSQRTQSRLTEAQVVDIRTRFAAGETQPALAAEYGIGCGYVSHIIHGHAWKHAGGPIETARRAPKNRKETAA